jgi:hypothetical protein
MAASLPRGDIDRAQAAPLTASDPRDATKGGQRPISRKPCTLRVARPVKWLATRSITTETTTMTRMTLQAAGRHASLTMRAASLMLTAFAISAISFDAARAQTTSPFTVKISEKEMKLEHPTDMMWDKHLMWDLSFQRMNDRNMPYIELMNAATNTAPITEFHMTIGDSRFNFANNMLGTFALLGSTTPGFQLTSSTVDGNELIVMIGNGGLQPGSLVRFKVDIAVDPPNPNGYFEFPDFRTVLFDMNGINVYDDTIQTSSADNSQSWVVFDPATGPNFSTVPVAFQDPVVPPPASSFFNDNPREWGENDPVRIFELGGGEVIPEPTSLVLLAGMACGLAIGRRAGRESAQSR